MSLKIERKIENGKSVKLTIIKDRRGFITCHETEEAVYGFGISPQIPTVYMPSAITRSLVYVLVDGNFMIGSLSLIGCNPTVRKESIIIG